MRIAILQLARLGDILQTLPAIQGLKKRYPNCEITLIVRQKFADAARVCPHVDRIVELPTATMLEPLLNGANDSQAALARLAQWINSNLVAGGPYHKLINLTFSRASSYLASLIPAHERLGVRSSSSGSHVISDPWSQYFFAQVLNHNVNMLHLNDLFCRIAGVEQKTWPVELNGIEASETNEALRANATIQRIGIQLTASTPEKSLNVESWVAVCQALLTRHPQAQLVFFGSRDDLAAIEAVTTHLPAAACAIVAGTLRFHENVNQLRSCQWIVSPDTALVHLASLCGTRVVEIALGGVRPEETGPYGEGHHVLYPVSCNAAQLGEQVARVMNGERATTVVAQSSTRFVKCADGSLRSELKATNFTPEESSNFFQKAYYLLAEFRCAGRVEDIEIPELGDAAQPQSLDKVLAAYDTLCVIRRIAEFGQHYCVKLLKNSEDQEQLRLYAEKLAQLETMLDDAQKSVSLVKPLIDTWIVAKDLAYSPDDALNGPTDSQDLSGLDDLDEIIAVTEGAYRELGQNVEIVQQLLQTAVDAAKARQQTKPVERLETKEKV